MQTEVLAELGRPVLIACGRKPGGGRRSICFKVQWLSTAVSVAATGTIDMWTGTRVTRHAPHLETS